MKHPKLRYLTRLRFVIIIIVIKKERLRSKKAWTNKNLKECKS